MADLRLVLVTPEKTLFDRPVASIRVPMFDGSAGIYTGPVTAGSWANTLGTNDNISISVSFTNKKKVVETRLGCQLVVGAVASPLP